MQVSSIWHSTHQRMSTSMNVHLAIRFILNLRLIFVVLLSCLSETHNWRRWIMLLSRLSVNSLSLKTEIYLINFYVQLQFFFIHKIERSIIFHQISEEVSYKYFWSTISPKTHTIWLLLNSFFALRSHWYFDLCDLICYSVVFIKFLDRPRHP